MEDGLSQSTVTCTVQDRYGFIWLATQDGLNRFDAHRFTVYKHDPNDPNSLLDNSIRCMTLDASGKIWIGTAGGGLNVLDPSTGAFGCLVHDDADSASLRDNQVWALRHDPSWGVWAGTDQGLQRIDPVTRRVTRLSPFKDRDGLPLATMVFAVASDSNGGYWLGTSRGLFLYSPQNDHAEAVPLPGVETPVSVKVITVDRDGSLWLGTDVKGLFHLGGDGSPAPGEYPGINCCGCVDFGMVRDILRDRQGRLLVATSKGIWVFNEGRGAWDHHRHRAVDPFGLPYDDIRSLFEDREGALWIGTGGAGVCYTNATIDRFQHEYNIPFDEGSLAGNMVYSIARTHDGAVWVGMEGKGLDRIDGETGKVTHFQHVPNDPSSLPGNDVRALHTSPDGTLWVGTFGNGLAVIDPDQRRFSSRRWIEAEPRLHATDYVSCITHDSRGRVWVGTFGGGIAVFSPEGRLLRTLLPDTKPGSLATGLIRTIYEDREGRIWVGTDRGLHHYRPETDDFRVFRSDPVDHATLSSDKVMSLLEDSRGDFWIGTLRGGLNRLNRETGEVQRYTEEDGLPNNVVYGILEDDGGDLWISTNQGLARFNPVRGEFFTYTVEDGVQSDEFNEGAWFRSDDGVMYFGGVGGLTAFDPRSIPLPASDPPLVLTRFEVLGKPFPLPTAAWEAREIRLGPGENHFSLEFASLDYANPSRHRYAYSLEGVDDGWVESDTRRYAAYTHVPPGDYRFQVSTIGPGQEIDDPGLVVAIHVVPPFWRTWWFRVLLILVLVGGVAFFILLRVRTERERRRELERLVAVRTADLQRALEQLELAKNAEMEAQRFKIANQLAGTIAHEFNNPLGVIQGFCDLTIIDQPKDSVMMERAERIRYQVQRMHELVRKLLRLRTLHEIDYAAGLKILDIHIADEVKKEVPDENG